MHRASLAIIAIPLILLAATVAISALITEDAFARGEGRYTDDTSQAASVSNECLNPIFDSNNIDNVVGVGNCGGTVSQQDESGQAGATTTHQTANPAIELQRATTTAPPVTEEPDPVTNCVNTCFNGTITDAQQTAFEAQLPTQVDPTVTTVEELCEFMNQNPDQIFDLIDDVDIILQSIGVSGSIQTFIDNCLVDTFNAV
jgi:hypothetical protein